MIKEIEPREVVRIVRSNLGDKTSKKERVSYQLSNFEKEDENIALLQKCYDYWQSFYTLREQRKRNIRYKNGDQWSDVVEDPDFKGHMVKEEDLINRTGRLPLKHNIIAQIVRNLIGQHLANPNQSVVFARNADDSNLSEMLTNALTACHQLNDIQKLDVAILEELIISGIGCVKVRYDYVDDKNRPDGKIEPVNVNRLFFNSDVEDPRLFDLNFIGQLHEYTIDEIITSFAHNKEQELKLRSLFKPFDGGAYVKEFNYEERSTDFYMSENPSKFRVYEIWQREGRWITYIHDPLDGTHEISTLSPKEIDAINKKRTESAKLAGGNGSEIPHIECNDKYEYFWTVRFIDAYGHTLHKGVSPYTHESHPYVIAVMPMIDGEFRSYISDIIDMQRYVNRLIMMIDFIMGNSAKGVLMLPEDCVPDGCSVEDFAQEYVKANGIIVYRPNNKGVVPTQITQNSNPATAWSMLQTQLTLIDKVSGVTEAMQGRGVNSSTPASLYAQQVSNSQLNYRVIFETLTSFIKQRDEKLVKVLMQFYTEKRLIDISGLGDMSQSRYWDPVEMSKIVDFNMAVSQSYHTPTYLMQIENQLTAMLTNKYIDFETFLKNSSMPYSKRLLAELETREDIKQQQKDEKNGKEKR